MYIYIYICSIACSRVNDQGRTYCHGNMVLLRLSGYQSTLKCRVVPCHSICSDVLVASTDWATHRCIPRGVIPDSKVHGSSMGPIWYWQDPDGPLVGPMNFAVWDYNAIKYIMVLHTAPPQWQQVIINQTLCLSHSSNVCSIMLHTLPLPQQWGMQYHVTDSASATAVMYAVSCNILCLSHSSEVCSIMLQTLPQPQQWCMQYHVTYSASATAVMYAVSCYIIWLSHSSDVCSIMLQTLPQPQQWCMQYHVTYSASVTAVMYAVSCNILCLSHSSVVCSIMLQTLPQPQQWCMQYHVT